VRSRIARRALPLVATVLAVLTAFSLDAQTRVALIGVAAPFFESKMPSSGDEAISAIGGVDAESRLSVVEGDMALHADFAYAFDESETAFSVKKLYVRYLGDAVQVVAGKNRLPFGYAYAWNPSDIANPAKSVLYRSESRRGSDTGVYQASLSVFGATDNVSVEATASALPEERARDMRGIFSIKAGLRSLELGAVAGLGYGEEPIIAGNYRFTLPFVGAITHYGEIQARAVDGDTLKYVLGLQYEPRLAALPGIVIIQAEYYRNEVGAESMDEAWTYSGGVPFPGDTLVNYGYAGLVYSASTVSVSAGFMKNLDRDGSGMINGLVDYRVTGNQTAELAGYYVVSSGDDREFSALTAAVFEVTVSYKVQFEVESLDGTKD
jgi:hypothetical protein